MLASAIRALWPVRQCPSDKQVARFIEEREPSLDDRLVSAVDVAESTRSGSAPVWPADDARRRRPSRRGGRSRRPSLTGEVLRRAGFPGGGGAAGVRRGLASSAAAPCGSRPMRCRWRLFPSHVTPRSHARATRACRSGSPLTIEARLVGNRRRSPRSSSAPTAMRWMPTDMPQDESGAFALRSTRSAIVQLSRRRRRDSPRRRFDVTVARPPRITRIDVEYRYPAGSRPPAAHRKRTAATSTRRRHRRPSAGAHRSRGLHPGR